MQREVAIELYDGVSIGTLILYNESGYMTSNLFLKWIEHSIELIRPTPEKKTLLILDNHSSHKSYQTLELAKQNSVVLPCLTLYPSHSAIRCSVFWSQTLIQWLKENPRHTVTIYQLSKLFNHAYEKTGNLEIPTSAFRATGISAFNPDIFPDHLFIYSYSV